MSRSSVSRLAVAAAASTVSTVIRVGVGVVGLWGRRTPQLVQLAASTIGGKHTEEAQATLRDEVIAVLRESTEISWLEMRRGVDDFDAATRSDDISRRPGRPHRVKP